MDTTFLRTIQLVMASSMFMMGMATFLIGLYILVSKTWGRDLRSLTNQTARLAQKGLAEDVAGLVGNASALLSTINELIRTTTGIGLFLTITGIALMGIAFWMVLKIQFPLG